MKLFVMRHGTAEELADNDVQRVLSTEGKQDIRQMSSDYVQDLQSVDVIWASPYVRTQQTAIIMAETLDKPIVTQDFLPPSGNPALVLAALQEQTDKTILIVSHQPLVGILVDGLANLESGRYRMGTGALACLSTEVYANGCCELNWLHQPASIQTPLSV